MEDSKRLPRKLAAILYADVAGYSRLTGEDEDATHRKLSEYLDLIAGIVDDHRGRVMHYAGDAVLAMFEAVVDALSCATAIQESLKARSDELPEERRLEFRIGLNLGDVIQDRGDIYGGGVNIAARLESLAEPGGICISGTVHDAIGSRLGVQYEFMGEQQVKNIDKPVRAYRVLPGTVGETHAEAPQPAHLELPDKPSIAILPFTNMSGDPEQEYFNDGIVEDIITDLSKISGLFVIARNSTFAYKGRHLDVRDVCRELGVRYALEGGVRKAANRVRITAQLIEGATGGHVWAERYDRELHDIFAVQDEVTRDIVAALALKLTPDERQRVHRRGTENLEAYEYFLHGRDQTFRDTPEANAQARTMLEKATELDPQFSLAFSHLARNHVIAYVNRWGEDPDRSLILAKDLAQRAVALDDADPHAHYAVAITAVWMKQHDRATVAAGKCLAIDPDSADGHSVLGLIYVYSGKPREAIASLHKTMRLDPHYRDIFLHLIAQAHFLLEEYEQAADVLKRRLVRKPESDISRVLLASIYGHMGNLEASRAEWQEVLRINPGYSFEHRRKILPYKNPADFEQLVDGLRKAGLAE
ncbi:MAG: adenylate/guanylate cyclase domain-containing protein [Gammaproteobacteria bacterium]|nr:MAG: adenylate/guanylate cyclase domain-containing protein [Gammaproteobacteria bacterium]